MKPLIVFLDWDGTLCFSRFWETAKQRTIIDDVLFRQNKPMVLEWMRGKYTSEEIHDFLEKEARVSPADIWKEFVRGCETMGFDTRLRERVKNLRKKAKVVLVTGNMDCFSRFTVPALGLKEVFDDVVNSSELGYLKTENEGKTFLDILAKYKVGIQESILVEDSENTCKVFEKIGGRAYRVGGGVEKTLEALDDILNSFV